MVCLNRADHPCGIKSIPIRASSESALRTFAAQLVCLYVIAIGPLHTHTLARFAHSIAATNEPTEQKKNPHCHSLSELIRTIYSHTLKSRVSSKNSPNPTQITW